MTNLRCKQCNDLIVQGTSFCRSCGAALSNDASLSEQQTAILKNDEASTTRRLDSRSTNPYGNPSENVKGRPWRLIFVGVIILLIVGCISIISIVRSVSNRRAKAAVTSQISRGLVYPGSRVILDLGQEGGGSVMQLETSDPLNKVQTWYIAQLQPQKILQATMHSTILRKDNVTATLMSENNSTTIVIKQVP
jgi:hypothetical protein